MLFFLSVNFNKILLVYTQVYYILCITHTCDQNKFELDVGQTFKHSSLNSGRKRESCDCFLDIMCCCMITVIGGAEY